MNNDQLLFDNYLMDLKSTVEVYVHGTLESSNSETRKILKEGLDETMKHQERVYNKMTEMGWYNVDNVTTSTVKKTLNNICSCEE